jgi:hypothetical protein
MDKINFKTVNQKNPKIIINSDKSVGQENFKTASTFTLVGKKVKKNVHFKSSPDLTCRTISKSTTRTITLPLSQPINIKPK